jgi:hypothetical protein
MPETRCFQLTDVGYREIEKVLALTSFNLLRGLIG